MTDTEKAQVAESTDENAQEPGLLKKRLRSLARQGASRAMRLGPMGRTLGQALMAFENRLHFPEQAARFVTRDRQDDLRMQLPSGEEVSVVAIWLAEVYTPTTLPGLLDRIESYLKPVRHRVNIDDLKAQISELRKSGGAAYSQLPWAIGKDEKAWFRSEHRQDELPNGVRYVAMSIHSLTRSTTVLVAQFVLTDDHAALYSRLAAASYVSRVKRTRFGLQGTFADTVKGEVLANYRKNLQAASAKWLADRFPGYFARLKEVDSYPSMDLSITKVVRPWDLEVDRSLLPALRPLDLVDYFGHWQSSKMGTRLKLESPSARRRNAVAMAARLDDLLAATKSEDAWEALQHLYDHHGGFMSQWAAMSLLREVERDIAVLRDLAQATNASSGRALRKLRSKLVQVGLDSQVVAKDIADVTEDSRQWGFLFPEYEWAGVKGDSKDNLGDVLRSEQLRSANYVRPAEADLRQLLSTSAELTVAAQNIRLQKVVMVLTVVSTIAAIAALVIAIQSG